ncbi:hypothetical protein ACFQ0G_30765 [Streptomyces chiangmaiensis]
MTDVAGVRMAIVRVSGAQDTVPPEAQGTSSTGVEPRIQVS